jgi:hypothetical protein
VLFGRHHGSLILLQVYTFRPDMQALSLIMINQVIELIPSTFYVIRLATFLDEDFDLGILIAGRAAVIKSDYHKASSSSQIVYRLHKLCYNAIKWKRPESLPGELYDLARAITPISAIWNALYSDHGLSDSSRALQRLPELEVDDKNDVMRKVIELPPEISSEIWAWVGAETAYSCFLLALKSCALLDVFEKRLSSHILHEYPWPPSAFVTHFSQIETLEAMPRITIFGSDYYERVEYHFLVSSPKIVTEVHFAMRIGGICAFKSMADRETRWYGDTKNAWFGSLPVKSMQSRYLLDVGHPEELLSTTNFTRVWLTFLTL